MRLRPFLMSRHVFDGALGAAGDFAATVAGLRSLAGVTDALSEGVATFEAGVP